MKRTCLTCGNPVRYKAAKTKYCSPACWIASGYVTKTCPVCGKQFTRARSRSGNTCSRECFYKRSRKRRVRECRMCKKQFERRIGDLSTFCSPICRNKARAKVKEITCHKCGKKFIARKRKFCSNACARGFFRTGNHPNWRGGHRQRRGLDWDDKCLAARERANFHCELCGKPEDKEEKLSTDHIIPYRLVKENDPINLICLCRAPCHVKKTHAERHLLRGDLLRFEQKLNAQGWDMERVKLALCYWLGRPR